MEGTVADDIKVPEELYSSIPDDADEYTKLYMRAQVVIQGAFFSLGDREVSPGEATLGYGELEEILSAALAMLVAGDSQLKTRRDIRERVETHAKFIRKFAEGLQDDKDTQAIQVLEVLRLRRSASN